MDTKCTRFLVLLGFMVVFSASVFREITAYTPGESLHQEISTTPFELGRKLAEGENSRETGKPLADTVRIDPLDKLKKYRGGYNISNKHYWSSTAFTGKYGYGVAALWLLGGVIYAGFLLGSMCCLNKRRRLQKRTTCTRHCYFWPILLGFLFTFLAIIASGVVLGGNARFNSRATTVKNIIIDTANGAAEAIYKVTGAIKAMQENAGLEDPTGRLNSTSRRLNRGAADIQRQARKNRRWVNIGLKIMYATTTVIVSLNLIAILALSVSGFLRLRKPLYLLIILCWIFTFLFWMYFGVYFFLEKFAGDTCTALVEYQQDPRNSSLSSILPCDDLLSAESVLLDAKAGIHDLIDQVNANISAPPASFLLNQARICNPFSDPPNYTYQPENCPNNTIRIGDIPQILERFACLGGNNGTCRAGEIIPATTYNTIEAYTRSIQNLLDAIPGMESLVDCQVVKDAINKILSEQCKPVKKFIRMVWAATLVLSVIMVGLVLTWTTKAHHNRSRHFSDGSVKPHSTTTNELPSDPTVADVKRTELKLEP
ncbi:uncharacterized protein LOC131240184 [Magnolia sinica]|uniref:uncharacterized protein LOC131240184 n=1 Tax=Magnolia sinica TaxID=86752 RepID=UPI00265A4A7C|nr:uncharacterized protein LOC131240184 [Magnolia sinica]